VQHVPAVAHPWGDLDRESSIPGKNNTVGITCLSYPEVKPASAMA
jgi:hypothetical protein